jgi:hypothetical protein
MYEVGKPVFGILWSWRIGAESQDGARFAVLLKRWSVSCRAFLIFVQLFYGKAEFYGCVFDCGTLILWAEEKHFVNFLTQF